MREVWQIADREADTVFRRVRKGFSHEIFDVQGGKGDALVMGFTVQDKTKELLAYGPDTILLADDPAIDHSPRRYVENIRPGQWTLNGR